MVDCTTNSYAHHRPIPPWTARTGRRDIARGRIYSRLGRGPGGATDHHAARPTRGPHHCREVPRKGDTTATFSLLLERAKWAENQVRLMYGILKKGRRVLVLLARRTVRQSHRRILHRKEMIKLFIHKEGHNSQ
eukprot:SAG25_NODE_729_length_5691_cov_223.244234_12_plen_134_part_00